MLDSKDVWNFGILLSQNNINHQVQNVTTEGTIPTVKKLLHTYKFYLLYISVNNRDVLVGLPNQRLCCISISFTLNTENVPTWITEDAIWDYLQHILNLWTWAPTDNEIETQRSAPDIWSLETQKQILEIIHLVST